MSADLPPSLATALRPALPELTDAIIAAIGAEVPAYARPLEGPFGRAVRIGVRTALARFVDGIEDPASEDPDARRLYAELGRAEFRGGRSLDALLSAYRIGARLAWERFVAAGEAAGHEPATLYRLASAIFSYIDGISADSVAGFAQERAETEAARRRRRRSLARLLARDDVPVEEVHDLARLAGWARPAAVAALVIGGPANGDAAAGGEPLRADRLPPPRRRGASRSRPTGSPRGSAETRSPPSTALLRSPGFPTPRRRDAGRSSPPPSKGRPPRSARRWRYRGRRTRSRERARRTRSCSRGGCRTRRSSPPTTTSASSCCTAATRPSRPISPRACSPRSASCARRRRSGCARPCGPGSTIPARCRPSPSGCTSIRRPCATASPSCGSCSATPWTTRTRASSSRSRCAPSRSDRLSRAARRRALRESARSRARPTRSRRGGWRRSPRRDRPCTPGRGGAACPSPERARCEGAGGGS